MNLVVDEQLECSLYKLDLSLISILNELSLNNNFDTIITQAKLVYKLDLTRFRLMSCSSKNSIQLVLNRLIILHG